MANILLYLLESSLCLTLLYAGYYFLFRKETYFNFIRIYLLLTLVLALSIPLVHFSFTISKSNKLSPQVDKLVKFKSYYEELIYLTDPGFIELANETQSQLGSRAISAESLNQKASYLNKYSILIWRTISLVYLLGILFFSIRFGYLLLWLRKIIIRNKTIDYKSFKLVEMQENIAPFSFMKYLFINKETLTKTEYKQILAHEITHINHRHSFDLLIVQLVGILQWFNPMVWRLNKAFKTTHEYIADRKVVEQGYKLLDYQSLLLRQLISIRSVELVNNFNLLSIKKRIAMMNKINSGFFSKAKAIIVIPIIVIAFFLIADLSCDIAPETISDEKSSDLLIELPQISQTRLINPEYAPITIKLTGTDLSINNTLVELKDLSNYLKNDKHINELKQNKKFTVLLEINQQNSMKEVTQIKHALRENNFLKIAYRSINSDSDETSDEQGQIFALPQKLPPMNAKLLELDEIKNEGIELCTIKTFNETKELSQIKSELKEFISNSDKYILRLEYQDNTNYSKYISYTNMVYEVVFELRDEYSKETFSRAYSELSKEEQDNVRWKFPMTLMQKNIDRD